VRRSNERHLPEHSEGTPRVERALQEQGPMGRGSVIKGFSVHRTLSCSSTCALLARCPPENLPSGAELYGATVPKASAEGHFVLEGPGAHRAQGVRNSSHPRECLLAVLAASSRAAPLRSLHWEESSQDGDLTLIKRHPKWVSLLSGRPSATRGAWRISACSLGGPHERSE